MGVRTEFDNILPRSAGMIRQSIAAYVDTPYVQIALSIASYVNIAPYIKIAPFSAYDFPDMWKSSRRILPRPLC